MKRTFNLLVISALLIVVIFTSCKPIVDIPEQKVESITSFYLLNEGLMGTNNASLDFYDYETQYFSVDIFSQINPSVLGGLGSIGNDLQIYGSKLYAVINASGLVEVMDAKTAQHIGVVEIPNCRNINFYDGKAYISSYAGPIFGSSQLGYVAEVDTNSLQLQILRQVNVGYQPEEIEFLNGKMYVANSGGYNPPNYDNTISVIDLQTFTETKKIKIAQNLDKLRKDKYGKLYVLGRGNYGSVKPDIYVVENDEMVKKLGIYYPANFCISGDSLYILSNDLVSSKYIIYDIKTQKVVTENFITDGTEAAIQSPFGITVNPITKEIFVTDAKNYSSLGELFCFSPDGKKLWSVTTGVCPNRIAFLKE